MPTACEPWPGKTQATAESPGSPAPLTTLLAPLDDGRATRQARAERHEEDVVAVLHTARVYRLAEGDRNRGGRGIAVLLDVHEDLVGVKFQALGNGINDADICLVRDKERYI